MGFFRMYTFCLWIAGAEFEGRIQRAPANNPGGQENNPKQTGHNRPEAAGHKKGQGQQHQAQHDPKNSISTTYVCIEHFLSPFAN